MNSRDKAEIQAQFGAQVRRRRKQLSLTQEKVGERIDMHRTYISSLERGRRNVSLTRIVDLARGLETTASDLVEGL